MEKGLLVRIDAKAVQVELADREVTATIRGRLFEHARRPVAVGDRVMISFEGEQAVVEEVLERRTVLARLAPGQDRRRQVMVSNMDLLCVVFALRKPAPHQYLIDRILVAAEAAGIPPALIFNKVDLDREDILREWAATYRATGYPLLGVSAHTGEGLDRLRELMAGRICALTGPSGAGKSSLLNALQPGLGLKVGEVGSKGVMAGRHTTTSSRLVKTAFGAYVADTPGVRNFEPHDLPLTDLAGCFPEIRELLGTCSFHDCRHLEEPGCAVLEALADGRIDPSRHESYRTIRVAIVAREEDRH